MKIRKIMKPNENCQRIDVIRLPKYPRDLSSTSLGEKLEIIITYENHKTVVFIKAKPILLTNIFADLQTPVRKLFSARIKTTCQT